jgi:DNA replication protein DnaC
MYKMDAEMMEGRGLYICGQQGVGKTHLAVMVAHAYQATHEMHRVYYCTVNDLVAMSHDYDDPDKMDRYRKARLVVVDGLGTEYLGKTGYSLSIILGFLRERYDNLKPTILTSRVGVSGLAQKYPDIHSLVAQCMYPIQVTGKDLSATYNLDLNKL